jgi:hypothetical protein
MFRKRATDDGGNMLLRTLAMLFCAIFYNAVSASGVEAGIMAMSAAATIKSSDSSSFGGIFSSKGSVALEQVMFVLDEDMNEKGATKVHLVIVYEKELLGELKKMSASAYFSAVKQLTKDHPDKMKVFEWTFVAKKRVTKWIDVPHNTSFLTPLGGFIFAN